MADRVKSAVKRVVGRGRAFRALRRPYYAGRRVECPCCGGRFRRFVAIRRTHDPDLECPRCGSYSRHRQLWLFLTERLHVLDEPLALLHIAPETFFHERLERAPKLRYLSADLHARHAMESFDVQAIPHPDARFDAIVCSHVLEHVDDDRAAMRELARVLRPGGWAIVQSPVNLGLERTREDPGVADPAERARRFGAADHVRLYGRDYVERLEDAGFDVDVIRYVDELSAADVERHGLLPLEPVYLCRRPAGG